MLIRNPADIGALIRDRRIKLGLDQLSLAKKAGTSRKWLIEVENGKSRAEIGLVFRTLNALGIVLAETDDPHPARRSRAANEPVNIDHILDALKKPK